MLVSAIGRFNAEKNTSGINSTFYGDKNTNATEKSHYDVKTVDLENKNSKNSDKQNSLNILA